MRLISCLVALGGAALVWVTPVAAWSTPQVVGREEPISLQVRPGASRIDTISWPRSKFVTVHFSEFLLPHGDHVIVRSPDNSTSYVYTALGRGDFGLTGGFFSSVVPGDTAIVEYVASATGTALAAEFPDLPLGFTVDKLTRSKTSASPSALCGEDYSRLAQCFVNDARLPEAYNKARAVARMHIKGQYTCTGWLIGSQGHLITNNHCIGSQLDAASTDIEFMAESPACADDSQSRVRLAYPGRKIVVSKTEVVAMSSSKGNALDYTLLKLTTTEDLTPYGSLTLRVAGATVNEDIYIPQHPQGYAKRIAADRDDTSVARLDFVDYKGKCGEHRLGYVVDTDQGSSGSPVLSARDNKVIGLHNCGGCAADHTAGNGAIDIRAVIFDLNQKNALPKDALDDAVANVPSGPWMKYADTTPPPPPASPCSKFKTESNCIKLVPGLCVWRNNLCVENKQNET